ncbi:MAG TPA: hypothetical protein VK891_17600 [Euzebyales bacterium]|nr:hypothetical protein [Euzebyales bacterium]
MTAPIDRRPVHRIKVLGGVLCVAGLLGLVVLTGEVLRHPHQPVDPGGEQVPTTDPRTEVTCEVPLPREGQRRSPVTDDSVTVTVSSQNVRDCPENYDGRRVRYRGEVVGGLLGRDSGVWTQLNDDAYAGAFGPLPTHRDFRGVNSGVGVLLQPTQAALIDRVGGPRSRGDVIEIEGVFQRVDPTGEVAVIKADVARLVAEGTPYTDPPLADRRIVAILAVLLAAVVVGAERMVAQHR